MKRRLATLLRYFADALGTDRLHDTEQFPAEDDFEDERNWGENPLP